MSGRLKQFGIEVPPEERTPLVEQLLGVIEELLAEIDRLKGLPATPQRQPSSLNDPEAPPSQQVKERRRRNKSRRKGHKRSKFQALQIDETQILEPDHVPRDARRAGFKSFLIQDLRLETVNIRYRRACYRLPDGSRLTAPRPPHLAGQFGPTLRAYVLQQYYQNQVTQPLIRQQLLEMGVHISAGQISRLLTEGHERFHQEKEQLLPAAREVSQYFQADDTSARHRGQNGHTLHIGNEWFASFTTTDTKSRVNFLEALRAPHEDYVLDEAGLLYMDAHGLPQYLHRKIADSLAGQGWIWDTRAEWQDQLEKWELSGEEHRRIVTEAALFNSLLEHELYLEQPLLTDDAAQFKILGFQHGLCWLHAERHVARLIPLNARERRAYDRTRDAIWKYYQRLKRYRQQPTPQKRGRLERDFDRLFLRRTGYPELNAALEKIHARRADLLLVLERPELPLHNNLSENDIRQFAKMRKISGSTRSEAGRRCRDTFLSLKTTCRKLGLSFLAYLRDRILARSEIPPLPDLIRQAAATTA